MATVNANEINKEFTDTVWFGGLRLAIAWDAVKNDTDMVAYSRLKELVDYLVCMKAKCAWLGEDYTHWFNEQVCKPKELDGYIAKLKSLEDDLLKKGEKLWQTKK